MSTFDPITYSAVNNLKEPVGSMLLVPENFTNSNYVDTGKTFNAVTYPDLATSSVTVVDPVDVSVQTIPTLPSFDSSSYNVTGYILTTCQYLGDLYVFFQGGQVYKTTGGDLSSLSYLRTLPLPSPNTIGASWGSQSNTISVANDIVYINFQVGIANKFAISMADVVSNSSVLTSVSLALSSNSNIKFVYGGGTYVAYIVNTTGNNNVGQSTDGINFTTRVGAFTASYVVGGVAYGAGVFVLVTKGTSTNNIATSPDGITWTARSVGTVGHSGVAWVPALSLFVATANTATGAYYTSPDGITWTSRTVGATPIPTAIPTGIIAVASDGTVVSFSQNGFIGVTNSSPNLQVSTNGTTWTNRAASGSPIYNGYNGAPIYSYVAALGNTLVYFGMVNSSVSNSSPAQFIYCTSTDGFTTTSSWYGIGTISNTASVKAPVFVDANTGIAFETNVYSTGAEYMGVKFNALRTTDGGATWSAITITANAPIRIKMFDAAAGKFKIAGIYYANNSTASGGVIVGESTDGLTWSWGTSSVPGATQKIGLDSFNGNYYACLDQANAALSTNLYTSANGTTWSIAATITVSSGVAYGYGRAGYKGGYLIANGLAPTALIYNSDLAASYNTTLPSAFTFGTQGTATTIDLKLTANASRTVAMVTGSANVFISEDSGSSWQTYTLPFTPTVSMSIALTNDWIVVTSTNSNGAWTSFNGKDWTFNVLSGATYGIQASTSNGSKIYYGGPTTATDSKIWVTNAATSFIPPVESNVKGAKWVVKAKQT